MAFLSKLTRKAAPLRPPEIIYFCKFEPKKAWNYAYLARKIQNFPYARGTAPLQPPNCVYILTEKGLKLCIYGSPKYTFKKKKKKGCPLWPPEIIHIYISVNLDQKGPEIMHI